MTSSLVPALGLPRAGEARCASDDRRARARSDAEGPKGFARPFALRPFINRSNGTSDGVARKRRPRARPARRARRAPCIRARVSTHRRRATFASRLGYGLEAGCARGSAARASDRDRRASNAERYASSTTAPSSSASARTQPCTARHAPPAVALRTSRALAALPRRPGAIRRRARRPRGTALRRGSLVVGDQRRGGTEPVRPRHLAVCVTLVR
jgi:hypothetical protein